MPAQKNRILFLTPPSGVDPLFLSSFSGTEAMSRLFSYQLQMVSESDTIAAKDIVGKSITWSVKNKNNPPRFYNGFVSRFAGADVSARKLRAYRVQVVPWLWFLTRTSDCQIFQKKSVPDILEAVFGAFGFSNYTLDLKNTYLKRDYCVQYRETAFNFVSRLMEEEGIAYYFAHEDAKHTLVMFDQSSSYQDVPADPGATDTPGGSIDTWDHQFEFRPGKWTRTDYNFETPTMNLLTSTPTVISLPNVTNFEMFDYPGDYMVKANGDTSTKLRMQEDEVPYEIATATSEYAGFSPGGKFTTEGHSASAEEGLGFVVTEIQHWGSDADFETGEGASDYHNSFHAIPDSVVFHPGRQTPKPLIAGAQTAVVVGPSGEEIYTDKYGRVKVQFFWDRKGKKDENSSCWIRVSENWAGKNWGIIFNPRIGQEVVVEFLEGDPDRPIITGRVYNANQMPPYTLPDNQTMSTIKTRSSKGGTTENFNELRFEDKKGSEEIYFHAEKDFNRVVENNDTVSVTNNETITVGTDPKGDPKKNGKVTTTIFGDTTTTITKGDLSLDVQTGKMTVHVKDAVAETFENTLSTLVTKDISMESSSAGVLIKAAEQIMLQCGSSSMLLKKDGTIEIKGMTVKITGSTSVAVEGAKIDSNASGVNTVKGATVKINC